MPLLDKLKNVFANGGANLVEKIGDAFDKNITNKEELIKAKSEAEKITNDFVVQMAEIALKEVEADHANTANARETNTRIQESEHASWLAKNIAYCIDGVFVVAFIIMLIIIINKQVPESNKELFYTGFGLLGGYVGTIINFHRGTSAGSERKQKFMETVNKK